jgi:DNA-binding transcriptional MerR regulator
MKDKLTLTEARDFLGSASEPVSERTIQRYTAQGLLNPERVKERGADGRMHTINLYRLDELRKLKELKENPPTPGAQSFAQAQGLTLAPRASNGAAQLVALVEMLREAAQNGNGAHARPAVGIEHKLSLKLTEAAVLSGYSGSYLMAAIKGKLKIKGKTIRLAAEKRGRGWNIKKKDLLAFVEKL